MNNETNEQGEGLGVQVRSKGRGGGKEWDMGQSLSSSEGGP